jgi:hypothetical protein
MRIRGLLVAVAALAVMGGAVYWSSKSKPAEANKPASDTAPKLLSIPDNQIRRVDIRKTGGESTVVEIGKDGKWQITAPKPLAADADAMTSMLSSLGSLAADRVVEEKAPDLAQYGLSQPSLQVIVTKKDGQSKTLAIGDQTPTSSAYFARVEGDPRVYTIPTYTQANFDKSSKDLRDKRLLTFDSDKLTRLELDAKGQAIEFGKNNQNEWQILKPRPLRADGGQVEDLIRRLKDARMDTLASDEDAKQAVAAFASAATVATAKVSDAAGTQQLQVRRDKDKNYYVRSTAVEGVYKVGAEVGDGLDRGLDDFRNRKIFDFGWNDPSRVDIRDGSRQASYQKSGDKWISGGKTMDPATMQAVLDNLRNLAAVKFPEKGFTTPEVEVSITSSDGKRIEKVALAKSGSDWLARRDGDPSLYQLDPPAVTELQKAVAAVKEAAPAQKKK